MSDAEKPSRRRNRLTAFDYSTPGAYFITICTVHRKNLLGQIVGGGVFDAPQMQLSPMGELVQKQILSASRANCVTVDKYVIMPNHIHMILLVNEGANSGTSRTPSPTNAVVPHFVSSWKRFCYRDIGAKIFQRSYHDHVIRGDADYLKIWQYIDTNPVKWTEDCFYNEETERL